MTHLLELPPSSFASFLFFSTLLLLAGDLNKENALHLLQKLHKILCKHFACDAHNACGALIFWLITRLK